ncbi:MAG TPA: L,D-transpeptidase family protein [Steroidobacteraceae bacterium]|nr:L,D-transpeptidase family protein [Steroidobacteraceae bacterium]
MFHSIKYFVTSLCLSAAALLAVQSATAADAGLMTVNYAQPGTSTSLPVANRIVVHKAERRLELLRGTEVLRSYKVALGLNPTGHKERAGDFRTPEGSYRLTRRNARSDYFLSIQVSYPSPDDIKKARKNGWEPGGSIMIHGLPNSLKRDPSYYQTRDWTDGCIAVSNADMVEIWLLTQNNIPIDILP